MKALLCIGAAVPAGICASKANTSTGFGLLGRCRSLSFPRSTGPFIRAPLCGCSRDPPTPSSPVPEDSDKRQDEPGRNIEIEQPPLSWMQPWETVLDHIFGTPQDHDKLLAELMEPVNKLDLEIGNEAYDALLALIQLYFNLRDYEKVEAIQSRIRDLKMSEVDSRPYLLEAIVKLTLAMEKLRQGKMESKMLMESAEKSWRDYEKLKKEGFGLQPPITEEEEEEE